MFKISVPLCVNDQSEHVTAIRTDTSPTKPLKFSKMAGRQWTCSKRRSFERLSDHTEDGALVNLEFCGVFFKNEFNMHTRERENSYSYWQYRGENTLNTVKRIDVCSVCSRGVKNTSSISDIIRSVHRACTHSYTPTYVENRIKNKKKIFVTSNMFRR